MPFHKQEASARRSFSKKVEVHADGVAIHFMRYNFRKIHQTVQ